MRVKPQLSFSEEEYGEVRKAYAAYILREENPESINGWMKTIVMKKVKE